MMDCRDLDFSPKLSATRVKAAEVVSGVASLRRIIAFALFILGVASLRLTIDVLDYLLR